MVHCMNILAYNSLIFLSLLVFVQACGPSAEETRKKERREQEAAQRKVQEEIMVYEALELIKEQSQAIARGETFVPAKKEEIILDEPVDISETIAIPAGSYTIQVASLNSREKANGELKIWEERGFNDAFITQYNNGYRVRLGLFYSRENAQNQLERVNSEYNISAWLDRIQDETAPSGSAAASSPGKFSVQVSAVNTKSAANREISMWKERGFAQAFTQEIQRNNSKLYRIRLGRYETRSQAVEASNTVNEQYNINALVFEL